MQPGLGYKIALAVPTNVTFHYPAGSKSPHTISVNGTKTAKSGEQTNFFNYTETGLPYSIILKFDISQETLYSLIPGDEIGIFDGEICVGSGIYQGTGQLLITGWENDESQNLPGFTPGNFIKAKVYRQSNQLVTNQLLTDENGAQPVFGEGNFAVVTFNEFPVNQFTDFRISPNPFKNNTELTFNPGTEEIVKINVFDISGRLIKVLSDQVYVAGNHNLTWDGSDYSGKKLNPGVYFVIAETSTQIITKRVIILQ